MPAQTTLHASQLGSEADLHEGRHGVVDLRRLPDSALLGLESERRERPVVGAALGDAARKEVRGMRLHQAQEVRVQGPCGWLLPESVEYLVQAHKRAGHLPKWLLSGLL